MDYHCLMLTMWKVAENSSGGMLKDSELVSGEETDIFIVVFIPVGRMKSADVFPIEKECVFV